MPDPQLLHTIPSISVGYEGQKKRRIRFFAYPSGLVAKSKRKSNDLHNDLEDVLAFERFIKGQRND